MPMAEVSRIFGRIQSERLVFIADSCYSEPAEAVPLTFQESEATISDAFLDRVASGKGRVINHGERRK